MRQANPHLFARQNAIHESHRVGNGHNTPTVMGQPRNHQVGPLTDRQAVIEGPMAAGLAVPWHGLVLLGPLPHRDGWGDQPPLRLAKGRYTLWWVQTNNAWTWIQWAGVWSL